jgi:predicted peptidase
MKRLRVSVGLLAAFVFLPRIAVAASVADFIDFSLRNASNQVILPGRLYVPPEAATSDRPFIVFLHGGGEAGTNNTAQINGNIDNLLAEAKRRGAYLYAPQSPSNWSSATLSTNIMTMIGQAEATRNVDDDRLYVTGLSNGGGGTWNMLSRYPDTFAAAIPICGVTPASDFVASRLLDEPVWAFHARNDTVVSVNVSRGVVNNILSVANEPRPTYPAAGTTSDFFISNPDLASHRTIEDLFRGAGGVPEYLIPGSGLDLMYYELATGGHGIWPAVYNFPPLYDWLFSHTTAIPEPSTFIMLLPTAIIFATMRRRRNRSTSAN